MLNLVFGTGPTSSRDQVTRSAVRFANKYKVVIPGTKDQLCFLEVSFFSVCIYLLMVKSPLNMSTRGLRACHCVLF